MELHQLREVAPASPRSSLSISLEIVQSCCISMEISGTVRRHEFRGGFAKTGYFKQGYSSVVALCDTTHPKIKIRKAVRVVSVVTGPSP